MEFNFELRVVLTGTQREEVTERDVIDFVHFQLHGGSISNDNPIIDDDKDCEIKYTECY